MKTPGLKAQKGERTRRRILEAAAELFTKGGYAGTSLKDIADATDIRVASLYYHFESKEALVDAVLDIGLESIETATMEAVTSMGSNTGALTRLRAAIAAHVRTNLAAGAFASANLRILGQVPRQVRERHAQRQRSYSAFWDKLVSDGRESGELRQDFDPTAVRLLLLGAMNWTVEWYNPQGRLSTAEIAATCCEMVLAGLQVREQEAAVTKPATKRARPSPRRNAP